MAVDLLPRRSPQENPYADLLPDDEDPYEDLYADLPPPEVSTPSPIGAAVRAGLSQVPGIRNLIPRPPLEVAKTIAEPEIVPEPPPRRAARRGGMGVPGSGARTPQEMSAAMRFAEEHGDPVEKAAKAAFLSGLLPGQWGEKKLEEGLEQVPPEMRGSEDLATGMGLLGAAGRVARFPAEVMAIGATGAPRLAAGLGARLVGGIPARVATRLGRRAGGAVLGAAQGTPAGATYGAGLTAIEAAGDPLGGRDIKETLVERGKELPVAMALTAAFGGVLGGLVGAVAQPASASRVITTVKDYLYRNKDPHGILGLKPDATVGEIRVRRRDLADQFHPDRNPETGNAEIMAQINRAADDLLARTERVPAEPVPEPTVPEPTRPVAEAPTVPAEPRGVRRRVADIIDPERAQELRAAERALEVDPLTGLGNRVAFDKARATAEPDPETSVIVLDVNNLHAYNAARGHDAGDELLRRAARTIAGVTPRAFHQSGDEFMALVPTAEAEATRDRIETAFGQEDVEGYTVSITGTIGQTFEEADALLGARKDAQRVASRPVAEQPTEIITAAAIQFKDGTIFKGRIHVHAIQAAQDAGMINEQTGQIPEFETGFVTSTGRFVDAKEAATIGKTAEQLPQELGLGRESAVAQDFGSEGVTPTPRPSDVGVEVAGPEPVEVGEVGGETWPGRRPAESGAFLVARAELGDAIAQVSTEDVAGTVGEMVSLLSGPDIQPWMVLEEFAPRFDTPAINAALEKLDGLLIDPSEPRALPGEVGEEELTEVGRQEVLPVPGVTEAQPTPAVQPPVTATEPEVAPVRPTAETIRGMAFRFPNGEIIEGTIHGEIYNNMTPEQLQRYEALSDEEAAAGSGAMTSDGRFVSIEEAAEISAAEAEAAAIWLNPMKDEADLEPERFQYQEKVGLLKRVKVWRREQAGIVAVWRDPADGRLKVVNGHKRWAKAKELGETRVRAMEIQAATAEEARIKGAKINISEGHGTAIDAAKIFREQGMMDAAALTAEGIPLSQKVATEGLALAQLQNGLFDLVARGEQETARMVIIGRILPNHDQQLALWEYIKQEDGKGKLLTNEEVEFAARDVLSAPVVEEKPGAQIDLIFGDEGTKQRSLYNEARNLKKWVRRELAGMKGDFAAAARAKRAARLAQEGVGELDTEKAKSLREIATQNLALFDQLSGWQGPISDVFNRGAEEIDKGADPNEVRQQTLRDTQRAIQADLEGRPVERRGRGPEVGEDHEVLQPAEEAEAPPTAPAAEVEEGLSQEELRLAGRGPEGLPATEAETGTMDLFTDPAERPLDPLRKDFMPPTIGSRMATDLPTPEEPMPGGPVSAPQIITSLSKVTEAAGKLIPQRIRRMGPTQAEGQWDPRTQVIRTRNANDIQTAAHEVAHAIENLLFGRPKGGPWKAPRAPIPMQDELVQLGRNLYGEQRPANGYKREGWAEFVRMWVTESDLNGDKVDMSTVAPAVTKWFEGQFSKEYPEVRQALDDARELAHQWRTQGSKARAEASIIDLGTPRQRLRKAGQAIRKFVSMEKLVEMAQPLHELSREAERQLGRELEPSEDPFFTISALRTTHAARTREMVESGMMDLAGNRVGPSLDEIRPLVKGKQKDFVIYLWAKRTLALAADPMGPRASGLSPEDAQQLIAELETPGFELAASKVYAWNDGVLNYAAQASPTFARVVEAVRFRDPGSYLPLQREFEELDNMWARSASGATKRSPVQRLRGSGRRIKSPFPIMIAQTERTLRQAHERLVLDQIMNLSRLEGMGHLVEEVPVSQLPAASTTIKNLLEQINKEIVARDPEAPLVEFEEGMEPDKDILGAALTFFTPSQQPAGKDPIFPIYDQGKVRWFEVDRQLYDALSSLDVYRLPDVAGLPIAEALLGKPAALMRAGTTGLRASFALLWNPLRDVQTMWVNTRSGAMAPRLLSGWMQSMKDMALARTAGKRDEWVDAWMRLGGEMAQPLGQDIPHTRRAARRLFEGRVVRTLDPRNWFDFYRDLIQFPEGAPRVAELKAVAEEVGWEPGIPMSLDQSMEMLLASKQVTTDFTAAGEIARIVNRMVPFHNAAIQGPRANIRAAKRDPQRFAWRGLQIAALTMLLWWKNKDEEWYKELDYRDRFTHWYFDFTNPSTNEEELIRIPRAFEVGVVFSALPEMILDAFYTEQPEQATEWFKVFLEVTAPNMTPVLLGEMMQQAANRDFYFDAPIVPAGEQRRPPEEQYNHYTSRASIALGEAFNVSPRRLDHAVRSIFGPVGQDLLGLLGVGPKESGREKELADLPLVGRMFQRGGTIGTRPLSIRKLYDTLEEAQLRQASEKYEESEKERQIRLQLNDATRAVSALSYVRQHTQKSAQRRALMQEALAIAQDALKAAQAMDVNRGKFQSLRQGAEQQEERTKFPDQPVRRLKRPTRSRN